MTRSSSGVDSRSVVLERVGEFARMRLDGASWAGVSIGLTLRDRAFGVVTEGHADLEAREPVGPEHLFQLGSIGKSFTAIALLQLHEEGRLDLHAPVSEYLPWFEVKARFEPITIHHLLTHTSGLFTGMEISTDGAFDVWALREEEVGFAPGTNFHYSNLGYRTLGLVLETITKSSYPEEIGSRILRPLGMRATEPAITNAIRPRCAVGYTQLRDDRVHRRDSPLAPATWFVNATGDGCISSTPADMAAYVRMLMNRGRGPVGRLLSEESFGLLTQRAADRDGSWYGYGLHTWEVEGRRHLGHGGGMVGFFSDMRADLDSGVGAIVMVNAPDFEVSEDIGRDALAVLRAAASGQPLPEVPPPIDPMRVQEPERYEGTYRGVVGDVTVHAEDGHLWMEDGEERAALEPLERDQFVPRHDGLDQYRVRFHRDGQEVAGVTHGPRHWQRSGTKPAGRSGFDPTWARLCGHYRSFNPWAPDIRVFHRDGSLYLVSYPVGTEDRLVPTDTDAFQVGDQVAGPHRIRFDAPVEDRTLRATISGAPYYRSSM